MCAGGRGQDVDFQALSTIVVRAQRRECKVLRDAEAVVSMMPPTVLLLCDPALLCPVLRPALRRPRIDGLPNGNMAVQQDSPQTRKTTSFPSVTAEKVETKKVERSARKQTSGAMMPRGDLVLLSWVLVAVVAGDRKFAIRATSRNIPSTTGGR